MKFSLSWLKDHLDTTATLDEITATLTRLGLEVEGVDNPGEKLAAFRVAYVIEAKQHPNADKLRVCLVDTGEGAPLQVVCGAPNARTGMKAVFGAAGAYVPGSGITLKVAAIRGVESNGMLCSARELELGEDHDGILDLPDDAPVGTPYADYAGLNDPVIEIAITPNRADCLGVAGVARDLAAAGLGTLKTRPIEAVPGSFQSPISVSIADTDGCPLFIGRFVRGVKNGPSPAWLQQRLRAIGLRPISALVDITNFLTHDRGRPLHVFDAAKVSGHITARRGVDGETLVALDGKSYTLTDADCVIADDAGAEGIGGVMGGEHSGCTDATTDVFIEAAWFTPARIATTGRRLGINSDARYRFERGVDPAFVQPGMELATKLILELCGGEASELVIAGSAPDETRVIDYRPERCATLGGMDVEAKTQKAILESLGFVVAAKSGVEQDKAAVHALTGGGAIGVADWSVTPPSWRRDVDGEADIVEEVLRLTSYDAIPSTPMPRADGVAKPILTADQSRLRRVRRLAASRGYAEAITWSFIDPAQAALFEGASWTLDNPISADLAVMRPTLLSGLLSAAQRNMDRGQKSVRLFESGKRYLARNAGFERPTLALLAAGAKSDRHWSGKSQGFDAFDAKAEALALLEAAGAPVDRLQVTTDAPAWFHPGRSGVLRLGPQNALGVFGELHPRIIKAFGVKGVVVAAELYLDAVPQAKAKGRARARYATIDLQSVERDFAFIVAADVSAAKLISAIKGADKDYLADVSLFDVFAGQGLEPGTKSIAVSVRLQPKDKTFTDAEIAAISDKLVAAAAKAVGAVLRS
jgi:phenylalanyl-tRNA synthetase beta chain